MIKDKFIDEIFEISINYLIETNDERNINDVKIVTKTHHEDRILFWFYFGLLDFFAVNITVDSHPIIFNYYNISSERLRTRAIYTNNLKMTKSLIFTSKDIELPLFYDKYDYSTLERINRADNNIYYYDDGEGNLITFIVSPEDNILLNNGATMVNMPIFPFKKTECQISHLYDNMKNLNDLLK